MFKVIYKSDGMIYCIVYDVETYVEYIVSIDQDNRDRFTMRVDSIGKPILYKH